MSRGCASAVGWVRTEGKSEKAIEMTRGSFTIAWNEVDGWLVTGWLDEVVTYR